MRSYRPTGSSEGAEDDEGEVARSGKTKRRCSGCLSTSAGVREGRSVSFSGSGASYSYPSSAPYVCERGTDGKERLDAHSCLALLRRARSARRRASSSLSVLLSGPFCASCVRRRISDSMAVRDRTRLSARRSEGAKEVRERERGGRTARVGLYGRDFAGRLALLLVLLELLLALGLAVGVDRVGALGHGER